MSRHRILQIFSRYRYFGGEEGSIYRIGDALQDHYDVEYFLSSTDDLLGKTALDKARAPGRMLHNLSVSRKLKDYQYTGQFGFWQIHNVFPGMSPSVYTTARQLGVPVVQFLHNYRLSCVNGFFLNHGEVCHRCIHGNFLPAATTACWHNSHVSSGVMGAVLTRVRWLKVYDQIARYVAISQRQKELHIEMGIDPLKIDVVYHFHTPSEPPTPAPANGHALFIGRLSPEKGGMHLLRAWARLEDRSRQLVIVGEGSEEAAMREFCAEKGLENVRFTGFLNESSQKEIWEKTAFIVVPSIWEEPFGMVLLEAWGRARPVIAHAIGALTELITPGETGWLTPSRNEAALASAMEHAFAHPSEVQAAGMAGSERVLTDFSKEVWRGKMFDLYKKIGFPAF